MKGSDYIIDYLLQQGVHHMFGYPGAVVCHIMDSAYKRCEMKLHLNYHEQASAFAACGYAMSTGNLAVAYSNGGPGMTNLVTGIADAWYDSLPVLFIVGQVDTTAMRNELNIRQKGIQEIPSAKLVSEIVKYSDVVTNSNRLRYCLEKACYEAVNGRPGPVLLEIPADVQRADIDIENTPAYEIEKEDFKPEQCLHILEEALKTSKRPCVLVGNGVKVSGYSHSVRNALENLGVPVVSSLPALDFLPFNHKLFFGFVGNNGNRYSNFILGKSDLIISLGSRLDVKIVGNDRNVFAKNARLFRIDVDEKELTYKVRNDEIDICANVGNIASVLSNIHSPADYSEWIEVCNKLKEKFYGFDFREYHYLLKGLLDKAKSTGVFTVDVGQHEIYTLQVLQLCEGQKVAMSSGLASMGFGIPAAIGAYYGKERPSVCVCGDGGFLMNVQEFQYIAREQIPVKVVVFNNQSLGMIREFQTRNFDGNCVHSTTDYGYEYPNIELIAKSYGLQYRRVEKKSDIDAIDMDEIAPMVIELLISEETELYPRFKRGFEVQDMVPEVSIDDYNWAMKL